MDQNPAVLVFPFFGQADCIVVIQLCDRGIRAKGPNVIQSLLCASLRHVNDTLLTQAVGSPGNAASVVAVRCRHEGDLTDLLFDFRTDQLLIRKFGDVHAQLFGDVIADGVASAEHLESIQTETIALILHMDGGDAQFFCQSTKICQRSLLILGKALVEAAGLLCALRAEALDRIEI